METITISKQEYQRLKEIEEKYNLEDNDLVKQFKDSLEDLKRGDVERLR